jgi:predicted lactoylglutathione lyase
MGTKIFVNLPVRNLHQHGFQDLDRHIWELVWMDPNAIKPQ